ncbi:MAG: pyridoxamine 5'-phosphate oxidase family protein [Sulfitobacter sp.]
MAKQFDEITEDHRNFIAAQHLFFCGTAADEGRVNVSTKGMDTLKVLGPNRIIWQNWTGSGNETAAHLARINRMTLMWCGFEKRPLVLRIYGNARTLHPRDADFAPLNDQFPPTHGARQVFDMTVDLVQTSCSWGIPFYEHKGSRDVLKDYTEGKGAEGIRTSWEKNRASIDGLPTHIFDETPDA